jgi:hypothetical protein
MEKMKWAVYVERIKLERKILLGKIKRERDDNIKTKLTKIGQQNMDCIRQAFDREKEQIF